MASLSAMRDGIKTRLDTIPSLAGRVHDTIPGQINPPAAVIRLDTLAFDSTMDGDSDDFLFIASVFVATGVDRVAQDNLDAYLAGSGPTSVRAAIAADDTLGGACAYASVIEARNYGLVEYAAVQYLGVDFVIEVGT